MLSKEYRLTTEVFQKVFEKGSVSHTEHFLLRILSVVPGKNHPSFAVVVSKKLGKTAVIRNRNRRIIYTVLGNIIKKDAKNQVQTIIFLKKNIDQCTIEQIQRELTEILVKAHVLA